MASRDEKRMNELAIANLKGGLKAKPGDKGIAGALNKETLKSIRGFKKGGKVKAGRSYAK